MHPAPPVEHAHAGHPTLRAIAEAVRNGRQLWTVKQLAEVFPEMSDRFFLDLTKGRLEATAHSASGPNGKPSYRVTTRSIITYFLETTSGLTQAEIIECMALMLRSGLSRRALEWLRAAIDRQLAQMRATPEIHLSGEAAGQAVAITSPTAAARRLADAHPTLFDLATLGADHTTPTTTTPTTTPTQHAA